jgi:hypothetical protein
MKPGAKYRQPCGCLAQGSRWLELCEAHQAEEREVRERWKQDHERAAQPPREIA